MGAPPLLSPLPPPGSAARRVLDVRLIKKRGLSVHLDSLAPPSSSLSLCLSFTQSLPSSPSAEQQQECFVTLGPAVCLSVCLSE